jgi:hypothetical protein
MPPDAVMFDALKALLAVRPRLHSISTAGRALQLGKYELLHAGPPLRDQRRPPETLVSSIVMTCLHEGWATSAAEAESLLRDGALRLEAAQDHRCVTPLAAIVSPGTPLFDVRDGAKSGSASMWAPVSTIGGVDTRMGARDAGLLQRLAVRDTHVAAAIEAALECGGPIELWPLAAHGLAEGDDLHSRTTAANMAFADELRSRGIGDLADDIIAAPLFFLTLWMAASALVLRAGEGGDVEGLVTRAGGNGERFAIALGGRPERWVACDAEAPQGTLLASAAPGTLIAGAIGDSAVIDMLGFGGQRLAHAPEPLGVFDRYLPPDHAELPARLLCAPQSFLIDSWPLGIDAARVVSHGAAPLVMLARLAFDGIAGFVGRGVYRPPLSLFEEALFDEALFEEAPHPALMHSRNQP